MNRRVFFAETLEDILSAEQPRVADIKPNEFANKALPQVARSLAGIEPYTGPWGFEQVAHLLRRTSFGAPRSTIDAMLSLTMDEIVEILVSELPTPDPPLNTNSNDTGAPVGETWVNAPTSDFNGSRNNSLKSWWTGLIIQQQPVSLHETMTLFWHNHFATEATVIKDARLTYRHNTLFRQYALNNFKELVKQVTIDPAMLRYLNGEKNTKTSPNENYARELQELFTVGKGPEIAQGNYTNYTEQDVQEAARVLTGWRIDTTTFTSYFVPNRHDTGNKQFSSAYQNTVILGKTGTDGATELDDLLNMIFAQPETAKFICRKLYRWFVYYVIDNATEANVISPLADIFRTNNYDIKPVLRVLFKSAHFYDPVNSGCIIKNPIDFNVGMARLFSVQFPDSANITRQYNHWKFVREQASLMQMDLCEPPNVAGWPAYYQTPQFHELWINSDTIQKRGKFSDTLATTGHTQNNFTLIIDPIAFVQQVSDPSDPNILINEFAKYMFPIAITNNQKSFLKEVLIPGLPDYEWTNEWLAFQSDPNDPIKRNAITTKLQTLLRTMMGLAEYHLM
ncbi:MAG: DUF1800 domain-containing protein [Ignavibacteriae bacterium]|nr:DUF1800 domain-containing protein [Ignavibacteriota bacterium]